MNSLGAFLRRVRKEKGITQDFVAERLGIVTPVLSKWENDKGVPPLSMLCKLCNILSISIEDCIACERTSATKLPPDNYDPENLGETVKKLRIKNGWSQAETGNKLFVTSQTISKWENGGVSSLQVLEQLSQIFAVTPTMLLYGIDEVVIAQSPEQVEGVPVPSSQTVGLQPKRKNKRSFIIKICAIAVAAAIVLSVGGWGIYAAVTGNAADSNHTPSGDVSGDNPSDGTNGDSDSEAVTYCLPLNNAVVCKKQEWVYNQTMQYNEYHNGLDFKAEEGETVYAVVGGTISIESNNREDTILIITGADGIKHSYVGITINQGIVNGTKVKSGDAIAVIGEPAYTERLEGFHLHFKMTYKGELLNPFDYLPEVEIITQS